MSVLGAFTAGFSQWTIFRWRHAYAEVWLLLHGSCLGGHSTRC